MLSKSSADGNITPFATSYFTACVFQYFSFELWLCFFFLILCVILCVCFNFIYKILFHFISFFLHFTFYREADIAFRKYFNNDIQKANNTRTDFNSLNIVSFYGFQTFSFCLFEIRIKIPTLLDHENVFE